MTNGFEEKNEQSDFEIKETQQINVGIKERR